jgi:hypothetical protein
MTKHSGVWSEEDDKPLPEPTFFRQVFQDIWDGLLVLIVWGFVLWLLGLIAIYAGLVFVPLGLFVAALTVAPGLVGLMVACGKAARGGFARLGEAVRGTFRLYGRSVVLALPMAVLGSLVALTMDVVRRFPDRQEMVFSLAFQIGIVLTVAVINIYLYPVLALYDTRFKQTVLLAGGLAARFIWQTLALSIFGLVLLAATMLHPLVWLFIVGPWCVVATNATYRLARRILPDVEAKRD